MSSLICLAQVDHLSYTISKLTPDDGLSQGSNYFRFEDSKGFMWITGNDALNRYDGSMVKVYNLDKYFKNCPNLQQGYGFAEDDSSNLYVGSIRGLYKYTRSHDKFTLLDMFSNKTDQVAMPFAFRNGKVWCFNKNFELATYDVKTGQATQVTKVDLPPLKSIHVYDIQDNVFYYRWPFFDAKNNIWLIGKDEMRCYETTGKQCSYPLKKYFKDNNLQILCSSFDKETNTLLLGTNDGIASYSLTTNTIRQIKKLGGQRLGFVPSICSGKKFFVGKSWPCKKIFFVDADFEKVVWVNQQISNSESTFQYGFDISGRLWMCSDGQGQIIFDFKPPLLGKMPNDNTSIEKTDLAGVTTFAEFGNKDILIQGSVLKSNEVILPFHQPYQNYALASVRTVSDFTKKGVWIWSSKMDKSSDLYFVNDKRQASIFCKQTEKQNPGQIQDLIILTNTKILCSFSTGLFWLNLLTKKLEKIPNQPQGNSFKINLLSQHRIAISYTNGDMWLATWDANHTIHFIEKILPGVQSFYMAEDEESKRFWVAANNGVYLLDERFEIIEKFDANSGLAGTYIYGLLLDSEGNAWCSHQRGLSCILSADHKIINYNKEDGIQDWDFNNRSFYKATDGTLYFGGINGFNYFKPPIQPTQFYQPEIYIDEIKVNGKIFLPDSNASYIIDMHLNASENNIAIHTIVKDIGNAKSYTILYGLGNLAGGSLTNNGTINFANLAPGDYSLKIGIKNRFFRQPHLLKTIHIHIANPFYRTIWFAVLLSFAFSALLFLFYLKSKKDKQKRIDQQQAALEQQRQAFTADLHDDIGASLSSLQINSAIANQVFDNNPKHAKELLLKVENQSQQLSEKIGDFIWSMKPQQDEFMTLSSRIKTYTSEILEATPIVYELSLDPSLDSRVTDFSLRRNILLIVKEALNNAAKYSKASNIFIDLKIKDKHVNLLISDDGWGIADHHKMGNGLANMKKRTEEMDGIFEIKSSIGQGVSISASMPCP